MNLTHRTVRRTIPVFEQAPAPDVPVVLVVTGDREFREVANQVLHREGYRVRVAAHAGHALLACLQEERIDLLLSELSMTEVSGPALAASLRRYHPGLRSIYLANAGTAECEGILVRPFTREDLLAVVAARATLPPHSISAAF